MKNENPLKNDLRNFLILMAMMAVAAIAVVNILLMAK